MSDRSHKRGVEAHGRLAVMRWGFLAMAGLIALRLFTLQVLDGSYYTALAEGQYAFYEDLYPKRGEIFAQDLKDGQRYPVATNVNLGLVYVDPRNVKDVHAEAGILADLFLMSDEERLTLEDILAKKDDPYEPIRRKVPEEVLAQIDTAKQEGLLPGIAYVREAFRTYPEAGFGGQVLGFVGSNDDGTMTGKYGLEGYWQDVLAGQTGFLQSEQDAAGRFVPVGDRSYQPAVDGADLVLTIDRTIQYTACKLLSQAVAKHGADSGAVVILRPDTGAVLAMCGAPDFDPNAYGQVTSGRVYNNPNIFAPYETGSIMKALTMAAGLDAGAVTPATTFEDTGVAEGICETPIRNADDKVYGLQNMTQVLEDSINTGVIFVMQKMGRDVFADYLKNFGLGAYSGIELTKEVPGDMSSLEQKSDCYPTTASFGQGITSTTLQMASAYAALGNGGHLMQPYVVAEQVFSDGRVEQTTPIEVRQVISEKTSNLISAMLVAVVENGHGKRAGVPGYYVAGKTGTAQVAGENGRYSADDTIGSFAGFAPSGDPKFAMVVRIDHPRDVQYAESTAGPLFGQIASFLLNYFEVPPQR